MFDAKPPAGLKPKYLHDLERAKEIVAAISRYLDAGRQIPREWLAELDQLEIVEKNMPSLSRQQRPCEPPPRHRCCCENDSK